MSKFFFEQNSEHLSPRFIKLGTILTGSLFVTSILGMWFWNFWKTECISWALLLQRFQNQPKFQHVFFFQALVARLRRCKGSISAFYTNTATCIWTAFSSGAISFVLDILDCFLKTFFLISGHLYWSWTNNDVEHQMVRLQKVQRKCFKAVSVNQFFLFIWESPMCILQVWRLIFLKKICLKLRIWVFILYISLVSNMHLQTLMHSQILQILFKAQSKIAN